MALDEAAGAVLCDAPKGGQGAAPAKPDWRRRWAVVRAVLGFCMALIGYVVILGPDDRLRETAMLGAFGLAGAMALGYVGFAVKDDLNWMRLFAARGTEGRSE